MSILELIYSYETLADKVLAEQPFSHLPKRQRKEVEVDFEKINEIAKELRNRKKEEIDPEKIASLKLW